MYGDPAKQISTFRLSFVTFSKGRKLPATGPLYRYFGNILLSCYTQVSNPLPLFSATWRKLALAVNYEKYKVYICMFIRIN